MHINFKFGKRDQKKYEEAISFLSKVDEGELSRVCKDALLFYAQAMNGGTAEINPSVSSTPIVKSIKTPVEVIKPPTQSLKIEDDYKEIEVIKQDTPIEAEESSGIDHFLDF